MMDLIWMKVKLGDSSRRKLTCRDHEILTAEDSLNCRNTGFHFGLWQVTLGLERVSRLTYCM